MSKEFKTPAYVYVYIDKHTDTPVYVGKVNAGSSLDSRINDHRHDHWYDENSQEIYYTPLESSATADILETAMINDYIAKGVPLFNIAKTTWGETSTVSKDQYGWIPYEKYNDNILKINQKKLRDLDSVISIKERNYHKLTVKEEEKIREIKKNIDSLEKTLTALKQLHSSL